MLRKIGIAESNQDKTVQVPTGGDVMQRLGKGGGNQIGFTMVSEIKLGESYGGSLSVRCLPLSRPLRAYEAIVMSATPPPDAARAFIKSITTPAARQVFSAGWLGISEPALAMDAHYLTGLPATIAFTLVTLCAWTPAASAGDRLPPISCGQAD
jgi:hypothetical protein